MEILNKKSSCTLLVKNLPKQVNDLTEILQQIQLPPLQQIKSFGRKRALFTFGSPENAEIALNQLHETEIMGKTLSVTIFDRYENKIKDRKRCNSSKATQTSVYSEDSKIAMPKISNYVQNLYACDAKHNFEQPPPPYLKYTYPKITADILDAISIALMSNSRFYTQVLHLMNRMNLEPPFGPRKHKLQAYGLPKDVSTQTDAHMPKVSEEQLVTIETKETSETELESSEDEQNKLCRLAKSTKRKQTSNEELYKKKARQVLHNTKKQNAQLIATREASTESNEKKTMQQMFELASNEKKTQKIALQLNTKKSSKSITNTESTFVPPIDLSSQQLTLQQLEAMPIFKNYQIGEASDKLYIKNLGKSVTQNDLLAIYARFTPAENLDIKLMQQGRMKGQAFVTFTNSSTQEELDVTVSKALHATNGFVLHEKPMIVCFGKK